MEVNCQNKNKKVLFYLLQQTITIEQHIIQMLRPFPLRFDILNLIITNNYNCNDLTVGAET